MTEYRILTTDEEVHYINRWQRHGDQQARAILVESQMAWIKTLTHRFCKQQKWREYDDALGYAQMFLLHAIDRVDPKRGRLITLISSCLYWELHKCRNASRIIRLPHNYGMVGYANGQKQKADLAASPASLDTPECAGAVSRLSFDIDKVDHRLDMAKHNNRLATVMACLSWRNRKVIEMRVMQGATLQEVGDELGITRERVRQLQIKAMNELRFHWTRLGYPPYE